MATIADLALKAARLAARDLDVTVYEHPGWRNRMHYPFTGGVSVCPLWHDTVTNSRVSQARLWELLAEGYTGLPGPIANMGVDRDGTIGLISAGGAYHAGGGGPWRHVPEDDGNGMLWGIEVANAGLGSGERWTGIQYDVCVAFTNHLLRLQHEHRYFLLAHKEWTARKVDPWSIDMDEARDATHAYQPPAHVNAPPEPVDDLEALMAELNQKQRRALMALANLGPDGAEQVVRFAEEVQRRDSTGNGVAMAAIDDHRQREEVGFSGEMYDIVARFIEGIEKMDSEPRFLSATLTAMVREARARGWLVTPAAFGENAHYRWSDDGRLQVRAPDADEWDDVTVDGEPVVQPEAPCLERDHAAGVGTSDADA